MRRGREDGKSGGCRFGVGEEANAMEANSWDRICRPVEFAGDGEGGKPNYGKGKGNERGWTGRGRIREAGRGDRWLNSDGFAGGQDSAGFWVAEFMEGFTRDGDSSRLQAGFREGVRKMGRRENGERTG